MQSALGCAVGVQRTIARPDEDETVTNDRSPDDGITIAHDVCLKVDNTAYGGKGYAHILESIVRRMRNRGFTQDHLDNILIHNPARALTFA